MRQKKSTRKKKKKCTARKATVPRHHTRETSSEQSAPPHYCTREFPTAFDALAVCVLSAVFLPTCSCQSAMKEFTLPLQYCVSLYKKQTLGASLRDVSRALSWLHMSRDQLCRCRRQPGRWSTKHSWHRQKRSSSSSACSLRNSTRKVDSLFVWPSAVNETKPKPSRMSVRLSPM